MVDEEVFEFDKSPALGVYFTVFDAIHSHLDMAVPDSNELKYAAALTSYPIFTRSKIALPTLGSNLYVRFVDNYKYDGDEIDFVRFINQCVIYMVQLTVQIIPFPF